MLLTDVPGKGGRREQTPAGGGRETRRTIVTDGYGEKVTGIVGVIGTAIEGNEVVLRLPERITAVDGFTLVQLHLAGLVEEIDVAVLAIEVLPGITGHHVHVVLAELLVEIGIEFQQGVAPQVGPLVKLADAGILGVLVGIERAREAAHLATGEGNIHTQVQVEAKGLETVDLVIQLGVADETVGIRVVPVAIDHIQRIGRSQHIRSEADTAAVTIVEITVGSGIVDAAVGIAEIGIQRRIEERSRTHGAAIGLVLQGNHALGIEVQGEVVVQEGRREGEIQSSLPVHRFLEGTLLVQITQGQAVRQVSHTTISTQVVLVGEGRAENQAAPVSGGRTQAGGEGITVGGSHGINLGHERAVFIGRHRIQAVGIVAYAEVADIGDLGILGNGALLGGDDDNTIGSAGSVDGGRGGVLQDGEALDVVGVDGGQRVGHTLTAVGSQRNAVDNHQRVVGGVQGSGTTHAEGGAGTRTTVAGNHLQAGHLTLEHILGRDDGAAVDFFRLDGGHGTGHIVFLYRAVADHNHLIQEMGILFEGNGGRNAFGRKGLGGVTDAGYLNHCIGAGNGDGVVAVQAGGRTVGRPLFQDRGSDDRTHGVYHHTFNLVSALGKYHNAGC